ncbi:MAG: hypothetical protein QW212_00735 [Nitrososphaerales archaeon]
MRRGLAVLLVGLIVCGLLALTRQVAAATTIIPPPDPGPQIVRYHMYQNTYTAGDELLLVEYSLPYTTLPTLSANDTFLLVYLDSTGALKGATSPYSYQFLGYSYGTIALYWPPATGPTWGESGTVSLRGNPSIPWQAAVLSNGTGVATGAPMYLTSGETTVTVTTAGTFYVTTVPGAVGHAGSGTAAVSGDPVALPSGTTTVITVTGTGTIVIRLNSYVPTVSVPMLPDNWVASTTVTQGRAQVCNEIITNIAIDLENHWNVPLTTSSSTGPVLSATYGQQYFSAVIPYFPTICGSILTLSPGGQVLPPTPDTYNKTYQESLMSTWEDSVLGPSIKSAADSLGVGVDLWLLIMFVLVSTAGLALLAYKLEAPQMVPMLFIPVLVGGIKIGVISMSVGVAVCALLFIVSMYFLFHRRAAV